MSGISREEAVELVKKLNSFIEGVPMQRKHGLNWVDDGDEYHLDQCYRIKPESIELNGNTYIKSELEEALRKISL